MNSEVITKNNERVKSFFKLQSSILENIERLVVNSKPALNGERFLTDKEVSQQLKISRRTLQEYRSEGKIAYIQFGGKLLYRESDIQQMLENGYRRVLE